MMKGANNCVRPRRPSRTADALRLGLFASYAIYLIMTTWPVD